MDLLFGTDDRVREMHASIRGQTWHPFLVFFFFFFGTVDRVHEMHASIHGQTWCLLLLFFGEGGRMIGFKRCMQASVEAPGVHFLFFFFLWDG